MYKYYRCVWILNKHLLVELCQKVGMLNFIRNFKRFFQWAIFDLIYMKYPKHGVHRDHKQISGCWDWKRKEVEDNLMGTRSPLGVWKYYQPRWKWLLQIIVNKYHWIVQFTMVNFFYVLWFLSQWKRNDGREKQIITQLIKKKKTQFNFKCHSCCYWIFSYASFYFYIVCHRNYIVHS